MKSKKSISLGLIGAFLALVPLGAAAQVRWSKEWEEMIEATQPSEKIMDAIGIKAGMTVADIGAGQLHVNR